MIPYREHLRDLLRKMADAMFNSVDRHWAKNSKVQKLQILVHNLKKAKNNSKKLKNVQKCLIYFNCKILNIFCIFGPMWGGSGGLVGRMGIEAETVGRQNRAAIYRSRKMLDPANTIVESFKHDQIVKLLAMEAGKPRGFVYISGRTFHLFN